MPASSANVRNVTTRAGVVLAVAALLAGAAPAVAGREAADAVAPLAAQLRAGGLRPLARAGEARRVYVVVTTFGVAERAALEAAGLAIELPALGEVAPPWHDGLVVQGLARPADDAALRALPFVRRIELPGRPWPSVGSVTTAGDTVHRGPEARALAPGAGAGVAVGVISDGVDRMEAAIASGDLPAAVELVSAGGPGGGSGREGTAMLEIVHDLAPGARLLFAGPRTSVEMVAAIEALAAAGADVIVDDLVFTDEPKFVDGPIARAARRFVEGGGVYVTAAGNFARTHWIGDYRRGGASRFAGASYPGVHLFAGSDAGNSLRLPPGAELLAVLQWNEPFGSAGRDFDLLLAERRPGDDRLVAGSAEVQDGRGNPLEALAYVNDTGAPLDAYLAVAEYDAPASPPRTRLNLVAFSRSPIALEHVVARESVFGHAAVEEVLSVAATAASAPDDVEDFSSRGPATVFFPRRETRLVPRVAAVNGVETAIGRAGFFANPFFGTSAAAPHVAACAALVRGMGAGAAGTAAAVVATALDIGPAGTDATVGAGLLDCAAAARLASGTGTPPDVTALAAVFSPTAGVHVSGTGHDADGDARRVTVRVFDAVGHELARREERVPAGAPAFSIAMELREPALAAARDVSVEAADAVGLASAPARSRLACPGDGSIGDAFCAAGDLVARLGALPPAAGARLARDTRAVTRALVRAGETPDARRARRQLARAARRLGRLARRARAVRAAGDALAALVAEAQTLRDRVWTLHANVAGS